MGTGLETVRNLVWGAPMLTLVLLCGAVCTVRLRFVQFRRLPDALRAGLGGGARPAGGEVTPLAATATALAASGGTGNIAGVAGALALGYLAAAGAVIWVNRRNLPGAAAAICAGAFSPRAVCGGAAGLTFRDALSAGLARGIFSNEAGLGSAAIAHGSSAGRDPEQEGLLGIFEVFADTTVICTVTALAILTGGAAIPYGHPAGAELVTASFAAVFGENAPAVTAAGMALFALTTVLTWGFYGARCAEYLLGRGAVRPYLACFCAAAAAGTAMDLSAVWTLSEILNGLTAAPNLLALLLLTRARGGELRPAAFCGKMSRSRPGRAAQRRTP